MRRGGHRRFGFTTWIGQVAAFFLLLSIAAGGARVEIDASAASSAGFNLAALDGLCSDRAGAPVGPAKHHRNCIVCSLCDRGQGPDPAIAARGAVVDSGSDAVAARGRPSDPCPAGPSRWMRPWSSRAPPRA
jgi:hypothetical protein